MSGRERAPRRCCYCKRSAQATLLQLVEHEEWCSYCRQCDPELKNPLHPPRAWVGRPPFVAYRHVREKHPGHEALDTHGPDRRAYIERFSCPAGCRFSHTEEHDDFKMRCRRCFRSHERREFRKLQRCPLCLIDLFDSSAKHGADKELGGDPFDDYEAIKKIGGPLLLEHFARFHADYLRVPYNCRQVRCSFATGELLGAIVHHFTLDTSDLSHMPSFKMQKNLCGGVFPSIQPPVREAVEEAEAEGRNHPLPEEKEEWHPKETWLRPVYVGRDEEIRVYDLVLPYDVSLPPGASAEIDSLVTPLLPEGTYMLCFVRPSANGVHLRIRQGIYQYGFPGTIKFTLVNRGPKEIHLEKGGHVVQARLMDPVLARVREDSSKLFGTGCNLL